MECHEKELYTSDGHRLHYFELKISGEESMQSSMRFLKKLTLCFARKVFEFRDKEGHRYDDPQLFGGEERTWWNHLVQQYLSDFPVSTFEVYDVHEPPNIILGWFIPEDGDLMGNRVLLHKLKGRMGDALRFV